MLPVGLAGIDELENFTKTVAVAGAGVAGGDPGADLGTVGDHFWRLGRGLGEPECDLLAIDVGGDPLLLGSGNDATFEVVDQLLNAGAVDGEAFVLAKIGGDAEDLAVFIEQRAAAAAGADGDGGLDEHGADVVLAHAGDSSVGDGIGGAQRIADGVDDRAVGRRLGVGELERAGE